jgi:hypothetical protein
MNALSHSFLVVYAFRMVLISTVLYGYYFAFLRNRSFHTYNRWYLLGGIVLSFLLPLTHFSLHLPWINDSKPDALMTIIRTGNVPVEEAAGTLPAQQGQISISRILAGGYCLVSLLLLARLITSVYRIIRTARKYPSTRIGLIRFLQTSEAGAPFSFFSWLFWDARIDPHQDAGRLIFLHESYHIRQRHTLDILGLELARSLCWFNPFFHLISREIKMLHEFAADQYALSGGQQSQQHHHYAELLVWQSVGISQAPAVTHSFLYNQLKRRITMLTQTMNHRINPVSRIIALPLLALLLGLFTTAPAHPVDTMTDNDKAKLLRQYTKNLRYPDKARNASQEGSVSFTIRLGEGGKLLGYTPLDTPPEGKEVLKISVTAYESKAKPPASMTSDEAHRLFQEETRRASDRINTPPINLPPPAALPLSSVTPGEYYLQISFRLERQKENKPL